jgi:hypothetical protein
MKKSPFSFSPLIQRVIKRKTDILNDISIPGLQSAPKSNDEQHLDLFPHLIIPYPQCRQVFNAHFASGQPDIFCCNIPPRSFPRYPAGFQSGFQFHCQRTHGT